MQRWGKLFCSLSELFLLFYEPFFHFSDLGICLLPYYVPPVILWFKICYSFIKLVFFPFFFYLLVHLTLSPVLQTLASPCPVAGFVQHTETCFILNTLNALIP